MITQIIVVDDDPIILKRAWNILSDAGMKAALLKSGSALFEYIEDHEAPDLILLDISMPEIDGFEVMKTLRRREDAWRETPVIFLTASEDEAIETKGLSL